MVELNVPPRLFPIALALGLAVGMAGCATDPTRLAPGSSADSVRATLGPPTAEYPLPDGGRRLEYARGPMGKHTWMLDFDARGALLGTQQVLTEKQFNAIRAGISQDELRRTLGSPSERSVIGWQNQVVWSYRYDSLFCQWFQVGINPQGQVVDTGYYPDPICDKDQLTSLFLPRR
ncbi:MAG: hypothetical protein KF788_13985 [Piscinibacter sp.]|nr:hypothetical protein [Piscinibacter sp.]